MIDGQNDPIYQVWDRDALNSDIFVIKASSYEEVRSITKMFETPRIIECRCRYDGCRSSGKDKTAIAIVDDVIVCKNCKNQLRKSGRVRLAELEARMCEFEVELEFLRDNM